MGLLFETSGAVGRVIPQCYVEVMVHGWDWLGEAEN